MYKKILIIFVVCALVLACSDKSTSPPEPKDLLERLQAIPGATVTEITPPLGYNRAFQILLTQPVDHDNPSGMQFQQRIYLSHIDEDSAMVMQISGYGIFSNNVYEMAGLLHANQLLIGHRYFEGSRPTDPVDWEYLTIEQAAADHHRIATLFKQIYTGTWVSTGASKGGMAALFYRRHYPDDVEATVAYVAPLPTSTEDPRFDYYLENVAGEEACRHKIRQFQRMALERRSEIIPLIQNYASQSQYTFTLPYDYMLEMSVLEYPFAFWQYGPSNCADIPEEGATAQQIFNSLQMVNNINYLSDELIAYYEPHYYQAYTQFGYYRLITDSLQDVLTASSRYSYVDLAPHDVNIEFDPSVMPDIISWLQSSGDHIIYIYGEQDPWSAGAIELTGQADALKIVQPFGDHTVRISSLIEKEAVYQKLEEWLGITIDRSFRFIEPARPNLKEMPPFWKR